jgi:signal transduction histidine kinase/DNA-binding response OmpR family regulator
VKPTSLPPSVVLVVEDNDADADVVIEALAPVVGKRNVVQCTRLAQALARLALGDVDVVLLDLSLPDASGLSGLHRVRALAPMVPVLVLTGLRDDRLCAQALQDGAQDYLIKGELDGTTMANRVRDSLERQRYSVRAAALAEERLKRVAAEEANARAQWLAEAGQRISSSLDLEQTIANIEKAAVPKLASRCVVTLAASPPDQEARPAAELRLPLAVADRVIGSLRLSNTVERGLFNSDDRGLAQELGRRAALALENAALYQQAKTAVALREEFLSIASHELRTPLSTLQMQLQMMQIKSASEVPLIPEELAARLAKCAVQAARLTRLVDTLLDVSLIASGHIALQRERFELRGLISELIERFRSESHAAETIFEFTPGEAVSGSWDRLRIEQVLTNLLTNGLKYGAGHPVQIELQSTGTHAELRVRDLGIGIEANDLLRIFNKFERAAPSRNYSGLGLGLYVTRQIVEAHGGTIHAESKPGAGSLFTVRLPLEISA